MRCRQVFWTSTLFTRGPRGLHYHEGKRLRTPGLQLSQGTDRSSPYEKL